jgi:hypothetical protein
MKIKDLETVKLFYLFQENINDDVKDIFKNILDAEKVDVIFYKKCKIYI